jgi:hypothetical protein
LSCRRWITMQKHRMLSIRTLLHLKPSQRGTQQLAQYGDRRVCMRYRYDAQRKKRFKIVELIIAEREWEPPSPRFAVDMMMGCASALPRWRCGSG